MTTSQRASRRRLAAGLAGAVVAGIFAVGAPAPAGAAGYTYSGAVTDGLITLNEGDPDYHRVLQDPVATLAGTYDDATGAFTGNTVFATSYTPTFTGPFDSKLYVAADLSQITPVTGTVNPSTGGFTGSTSLKFAVTVYGQSGETQQPTTDGKITNPATCFVNISLDFVSATSTFDLATGGAHVVDPQFTIPTFPPDPNGCGLATEALNDQLSGMANSVDLTFAGTATPKLGAPTGVTAAVGNKQATVSWTAPTINSGSPITSYIVTPYIGGTAQAPVPSSGTGRTKVVTGLTNGTAYTFKVAAVNAEGTGVASAPSSAITPVAPATAYSPFASWSAFVTRQYVDLTTKAPTSSQLSSWVSQLNAGTKTKGDLDDALRRGDENLRNVDPVVRVYRAFLGRAPDAGGLQFWIKRKRNVAPAKTWTVTQIATEFTNSNEFKTKYGSLTNRQFVTQIYTDVLGRPADPSGVNYWTGKLDRKEKTKAQVVVGFSESNEYKTKQAQNTDVAIAFIYLLGRAPTAGEAADWVARQKAGTTHAVLLTELLEGNLYRNRITG
ncbi:DUF4214 domain-containing protein [Aquihabitans daechungensis]|uniref:DUF4214 domain-containing protein n=1 Tax=Aquihabitans daechungensis TaxID=1052257 RepID=UPI003BA3597A